MASDIGAAADARAATIIATGVTSTSRLDSTYSSLVSFSVAPDGFCVSVSEFPLIVNSY
jgi:hypothetical protein